MNANAPIEQTEEASNAIGRIGWKAWFRFIAVMLLLPAALFVATGHLDWTMAWIYVGATVLCTLVSRLTVIRTNPDLIAERVQSLEREDVKSWDKMIVFFLVLLGPLATLIVSGLDDRFGWLPQISLALQLVALTIVVLGYVVSTWAMAVNRFFSAVVRIQKDRGQTVVTGGPYRFVRHPAYASAVVTQLVTPIMLGSLWALIPAGLVAAVTVIRTVAEDRTLYEELPGYAEYAQWTRYRLLPGVW